MLLLVGVDKGATQTRAQEECRYWWTRDDGVVVMKSPRIRAQPHVSQVLAIHKPANDPQMTHKWPANGTDEGRRAVGGAFCRQNEQNEWRRWQKTDLDHHLPVDLGLRHEVSISDLLL